jgi:hypothetical protein
VEAEIHHSRPGRYASSAHEFEVVAG